MVVLRQKTLGLPAILVFASVTDDEDCHGATVDLDLAGRKSAEAYSTYLRVKNIGNGSAVSIKYAFNNDDLDSMKVFRLTRS